MGGRKKKGLVKKNWSYVKDKTNISMSQEKCQTFIQSPKNTGNSTKKEAF